MSRRTLRGAVCLISLAAVLSGTIPPATSDDQRQPGPRPGSHSSDGLVGPSAASLPARLLGARTVAREITYRVAPGLRYRRWDETDARGTFRAHLLRADIQRAGLTIGYAGPRRVAARDQLTDLLGRHRSIAGVNADFFDISDTGAPWGVGVAQGEVLHGPRAGAIDTFVVVGKGNADIGRRPVVATIADRPGLTLTNVNSPRIPPDGIGVYTPRWGTAPGRAVTEGAPARNLRQVVVREGRVVSNTQTLSRGTRIRGRLLIGRGAGADDLRTGLPVGTAVDIQFSVAGNPRVAVSGRWQLLDDGVVVTRDDVELHPRTAVGIDQQSGDVLLLVVDGRQSFSRGLTLLELARLMRRLGAEDALNLDGGGSSTMVTRRPSGRIRVANSPSDGSQRPIPNGLRLNYRAP